ncbi:MAG: hypothetical protein AMXMBFR33_17610 [Candidatus Xenobia bacterium]
MSAGLDLLRCPREVPAFDAVVERLRSERLAWTEEEALTPLWETGEEARLHEDARFEKTLWGRWKLKGRKLANDLVYRALLAGWDGLDLDGRLAQWEALHEESYLLDPADPRLHQVHFSSQWVLSDLPLKLLDQPHPELPSVEVLSLAAAAGRFGAGEAASRRGFVLLRERVPEGAFLVQTRGRSMEPGIPDGSYLLVRPGPVDQGLVLAYHHGFADEVGSCVVKRVRPTASGLELVSDHPEYRNRPLLPPDASWEEVRLIGSVRKLSPRDFLESEPPVVRPTPPAQPVEVSLERLEGRRQAALAPVPPEPSPRERAQSLPAGVLTLSADGAALRLALPALPGGQGMIDVAGNRTMASNLRHPGIYRVQPQTTPYRVRELEGANELAVVPGLEGEQPTVFRAPLNGPGSRRETRTVRAGRIYRLLLPPCLDRERLELEPLSWVTHLERLQDWTSLELEVPAALAPAEQSLFSRLGLTLDSSAIALDVTEPAPQAYRRLASGEEVLVYGPEQPLCLQLEGEPGATVQLLAVGEGTRAELSLSLDGRGCAGVFLEEPPTGLLLLQARSGGAASSHLALWIEPVTPSQPTSGQVLLELAGQAVDSGQSLDLRQDAARIVLRTPPLWRVDLKWGEQPDQRWQLRADEEGNVELGPLSGTLFRAFEEAWLGTLALVCPGLWRGSLVHQGAPAPEALGGKILELAEEHDDLELLELWPLEQLARDWVLPLCRLLGYQAEWCPERPGEVDLGTPCLFGDPPALGLDRETWLQLEAGLDETQVVPRVAHLRAAMLRRGRRRGLLTNGRLWVLTDRSPLRPAQQLDLLDLLERPESLVEFVRVFGV